MRPLIFAPTVLVADIGVDGVGEVDRGRALRQRLHLALRRKDIDLVVEEVGAERLHELATGRPRLLPVHQRLDPGEPVVVVLAGLPRL